MTLNQKRGAQQYGKVAVGSEVAFASPHRLVQMLMEGALEKVATAKGHMSRKEYEAKGNHINWAISIIDGLRGSLNLEEGGEMANNLDSLYAYMVRRLAESNVSNEIAILDEVSSLLLEIKSAWDAIPDEVKQPASNAGNPSAA
ncbi:MAG: flagellar export chaperone FliS [Candidatus Thiodiazotropha sp. (ex Semelilucina semeliformis)]|nr:flagellar export chaperone FliS [Candidatus Thiodiazotropha sp. (ex Myrtea spinifera)]MCU7809053.1 flagellar export chaperone FliS [Candidatus Thiodiazotropha sp. (ex Semelilucina semeliformis)]MCU7851659.1 flagellar export chaperone FliS [Candidatus Thiodiazotropha sp. (ex Monitilora ramsayi)]